MNWCLCSGVKMGCCWKDPNANTVIVFNPAKSTCQYLSDMLRRLCLCQIFWLRINSLDSSTSTDRLEPIWKWRAQFVLQLSDCLAWVPMGRGEDAVALVVEPGADLKYTFGCILLRQFYVVL